jgi:uncharacterized protein
MRSVPVRPILLGLPVLVLTLAFGAYAGQRSMLFRAAAFDPVPAMWAADAFSVVRYPTVDGIEIAGWYVPPSRADAPVVLYFPGCQGHLGVQSAKLMRLVADGTGVLMAGYRGYAHNPGRPSETGLRQDAAAAAAFLMTQGIDPARTVVWGYSLGTALATGVAAAADGYAGLVLEAPFRSIPAVVASHARWGFAPLIWDRFDTEALLPRVNAPVLILHGTADRVIPWQQGEALSRIARRADLVLVNGGGHADLPDFGTGTVVARFVVRATRGDAG